MEKVKKIGSWVFIGATLVLPMVAMAALPTPTNPLQGQEFTLNEAEQLIGKVARFLIGVSIVIAVIFIVVGAIEWMSGHEKWAAAGKKRVFAGIIGALIVFAIGVILQSLAGFVARTFFN